MSQPLTDFSAALLYGILDLGYVAKHNAVSMARQMITGGIGALQLRWKKGTENEIAELGSLLLPLTRDAGIPLIINDSPKVAHAMAADAAHIGQDDGTIEQARAVAGPDKAIGRSTHSIAQAKAADLEGADYIGFGPLFATPTKPDYQPIGLDEIAEVHRIISVPIFCIGGIKLENLPQVTAMGARRVVIVSGILQADDPVRYCQKTIEILRNR